LVMRLAEPPGRGSRKPPQPATTGGKGAGLQRPPQSHTTHPPAHTRPQPAAFNPNCSDPRPRNPTPTSLDRWVPTVARHRAYNGSSGSRPSGTPAALNTSRTYPIPPDGWSCTSNGAGRAPLPAATLASTRGIFLDSVGRSLSWSEGAARGRQEGRGGGAAFGTKTAGRPRGLGPRTPLSPPHL
jgi:hypothetical protein